MQRNLMFKEKNKWSKNCCLKLHIISYHIIILSPRHASLTGLNLESRGELFQPGGASNHQTVVGLGHQLVNWALNKSEGKIENTASRKLSTAPWIPLIPWFWSEALCCFQGRVCRAEQSSPLRWGPRGSWRPGWSSRDPLSMRITLEWNVKIRVNQNNTKNKEKIIQTHRSKLWFRLKILHFYIEKIYMFFFFYVIINE